MANFYIPMSKQLSQQTTELWKTLSAPQTLETYKNTISLTWQIFQRLGQTLWLALCFTLVATDWLANTAITTGKASRTWLEHLQHRKPENLASETGQQLLHVGKTGLSQVIANARQQLGLPEKPAAIAAPTPDLAGPSQPDPTKPV
jgi:hypothetical protein